jgi:hypothetical protein
VAGRQRCKPSPGSPYGCAATSPSNRLAGAGQRDGERGSRRRSGGRDHGVPAARRAMVLLRATRPRWLRARCPWLCTRARGARRRQVRAARPALACAHRGGIRRPTQRPTRIRDGRCRRICVRARGWRRNPVGGVRGGLALGTGDLACAPGAASVADGERRGPAGQHDRGPGGSRPSPAGRAAGEATTAARPGAGRWIRRLQPNSPCSL